MGIFKWLFGDNEQKNTTPPVSAAPSSSRFDKDSIEDVCYALSWLVAEAGDSWVHAVLQDENPQKGWPEVMSVSATIDNWRLEKLGITTINSVSSYQKLGLSADVAQFLASIPFEQKNGCEISYTFTNVPGKPSEHTNDVMNAMRKGSSKSKYVQANTREVKIKDMQGFVTCNVD